MSKQSNIYLPIKRPFNRSSKQNQIYIDISGEKFVFENNEILEVQNMVRSKTFLIQF